LTRRVTKPVIRTVTESTPTACATRSTSRSPVRRLPPRSVPGKRAARVRPGPGRRSGRPGRPRRSRRCRRG
jgi:hypothetical protein